MGFKLVDFASDTVISVVSVLIVLASKSKNLLFSTLSFSGDEQEFLNVFFKDWSRNISFHLPYVYNMVPSTSYTYAPAYK